MPPSTEALLETHYTGLKKVLARAHNTSATGHSQEGFVQHLDLSAGNIKQLSHHM